MLFCKWSEQHSEVGSFHNLGYVLTCAKVWKFFESWSLFLYSLCLWGEWWHLEPKPTQFSNCQTTLKVFKDSGFQMRARSFFSTHLYRSFVHKSNWEHFYVLFLSILVSRWISAFICSCSCLCTIANGNHVLHSKCPLLYLIIVLLFQQGVCTYLPF